MAGLYHPSLYDRQAAVGSYWEASAPPLARATPPLEGAASCEVAVIGAGYTGLTAALSLAEEEGIDVAVLEAGDPGWGASGRNGGFCCLGGAKLGYGAMVRRYGLPETRRFFQIQLEAIDLVTDFCRRREIDADLTGSGEIVLAHKASRLAGLRDEQARFRDLFGVDCPLLTPQDLAARGLAAAGFHGGLLVPAGVGLHPLKYLRGLARAAIDAGARGHGGSPVTNLSRQDGGFVLATPRGRLIARKVIIATNGYSEDARFPALAGRLLPVLSNILVTRPLSDAERAAQGWTDTTTCADSRNLLHYFRLLPDGRFLFGGRGGVSGAPAAAARGERRLRQAFERHFPAWRAAETAFFWRGLVCLTQPLVPYIGALGEAGEEEGLYAALAYHGNGVSFTAYAGRAVAGLVVGRQGAEALPAVVRAPLPAFPLAFLRKFYLAGAFGVYSLRDALG